MIRRVLALGCLATVVGGCVTADAPVDAPAPAVEAQAPPIETQPPSETQAPPTETQAPIATEAYSLFSGDVNRLLGYYERLRRLPASELGVEHIHAREAYAKSGSDFDRVRYAMTQTVPNTAANSQARALELLDPLVKNPGANLHGLAFLLTVFLHEQKRLESSVQTLQQNAQGQQQNIQNLQQNLQGLQQKLDALKSLEKTMLEREQGGARKR